MYTFIGIVIIIALGYILFANAAPDFKDMDKHTDELGNFNPPK